MSTMQNFLSQKWSGMKSYLLTGDYASALNYISGPDRNKYQTIFSALSSYWPEIFSTLQGFHLLSVSEDRAEVEVIKMKNGVNSSFPLIYVLDNDGFWRLEQF